jgi:L-amino acid N-acyltransferase YncA
MNIRRATANDAEKIVEIYNWYVLNTIITFETEVVSPLDMETRIGEKLEKYSWLVGELEQTIVGYAYYGSFRSRAAYNHTVESSIYLAPDSFGKGFGTALYRELIESAERQGFREIIGVIALPNVPSVALHQKLGFEDIGVLKNVGYKFDQYIDVGVWQLSINQFF